MDATQFATFMKAFQETMKELAKDKGKTPASSSSSSSGSSSANAPKISIKIPTYKGEPNENVVVWLRQVKNIFHAQGIKDEGNMIHYAATGLEDAALHWFVNKVKDTTGPAFTDWANFTKALKDAFQPPSYQHYLRTQLKTLRQTSSVQEYGMRFRNLIEQIDTMNELDKVSYFLDGLKDATRREVAYQAPETFEDAWKLAIRYDIAMFGLGKPKGN
jgi:retrotransposon gag protein